MARCSKCSDSCGDDYKTKTKYKEEKNLGDRGKVCLLQMNDMVDVDNMDVSDLKAYFMNLIDNHFYEIDKINKSPYKQRQMKRKGK